MSDTNRQLFGGEWTKEKLDRLAKYLHAYTTIFTRNPGARFFDTVYVDAFAGQVTSRLGRLIRHKVHFLPSSHNKMHSATSRGVRCGL